MAQQPDDAADDKVWMNKRTFLKLSSVGILGGASIGAAQQDPGNPASIGVPVAALQSDVPVRNVLTGPYANIPSDAEGNKGDIYFANDGPRAVHDGSTWNDQNHGSSSNPIPKTVTEEQSTVRYADAYSGSDMIAQIDAAQQDLPSGGGTVFVPAGTYDVQAKGFTINGGTRIIGAGPTETVLKEVGSDHGQPILEANGVNNVVVANIGVNCNANARYGISAKADVSYMWIVNCFAEEARDDPITFQDNSKYGWILGNRAKDPNHGSNAVGGGSGIEVEDNSRHVIVAGNITEGTPSGNGSIIVFNHDGANTVGDTYQVSVVNNICDRYISIAGDATNATVVRDCSIVGNVCSKVGVQKYVNDIAISGNSIIDSNSMGIGSGESGPDQIRRIAIVGNAIDNPSTHGVEWKGRDSIIQDNIIYNPGSAGVRMRDKNNEIKSNWIQSTGAQGILVQGINIDVGVNRVVDSTGQGIETQSDDTAIKHNRVVSPSKHAVLVSSGLAGIEIVDNRLVSPSKTGVRNNGSDDCIISRNYVDAPTAQGILLFSTSESIIDAIVQDNVVVDADSSPGIELNCNGNNIQRVNVVGNRAYDTRTSGSKTQTYGLVLDAGSDTLEALVRDNDFRQNKTGGVNESNGPDPHYWQNQGHDDTMSSKPPNAEAGDMYLDDGSNVSGVSARSIGVYTGSAWIYAPFDTAAA